MLSINPMTRSEQVLNGCILGALIGDAAGGVLEFIGREPDEVDVQSALTLPGGGVFGLAPGQFTDDGEMTVSLLAALVQSDGHYNPKRVAEAYCGWAWSQPFDMGITTSNALMPEPPEVVSESSEVRVWRQAAQLNGASKANGSLMRATPLGVAASVLSLEEAADIARQDARLTHPNQTCQHATAAYVLAIRHLILKPGDKEGAWSVAAAHVEGHSDEVMGWLQDAATTTPGAAHQLAGFVRHAFTAAFYHLGQGTDYREALAATLAQGGDTDTNACIVGGLIGALHGIEGIPPEMLDGLLNCDTRKGRMRPDEYTIKPVPGNLSRLGAVLWPAGH